MSHDVSTDVVHGRPQGFTFEVKTVMLLEQQLHCSLSYKLQSDLSAHKLFLHQFLSPMWKPTILAVFYIKSQ